VYAEDYSLHLYPEKRLLQCFETPPSKKSRPRETKHTHLISARSLRTIKQAVLEDLRPQPSAPPAINWQKFANEHNVPGRNCGQVVKEFAMKAGIDTSKLECDDSLPCTHTYRL